MKAQDTVIENASNAYKTAGLSANQYMETVTSFSASLLQSVGGDTEKAAKMADQAVVDMADNANKFGTNISSIQNAYQGFAKQNYSMLDNLKLGYGGTQQEMYRLLQDAAKLDETFAKTAEFSIDDKGHLTAGFADITQAIHIVQTEMGITGTTAKEASSTIQGSVSMMKSSWENLVTGLADENADFDTLLSQFVDSAITVFDNVIPKVTIIAEKIPVLVDGIIQQVPPIVKGILPSLIEAALSLIDGIASVLPDILTTVTDMLPDVVTSIINMLPDILEAVMDIIASIFNALANMGPDLVVEIIKAVNRVVTTLIDNIPTLLEAALDFFMAIVDSIPLILDALLTNAEEIIGTIVGALLEGMPKLMDGAVKLFYAIIEAIPQILPVLIDNIPPLVNMIVDLLLSGSSTLLDGALQLLVAIVQAIPLFLPQLIEAVPDIIDEIIDCLLDNLPLLLDAAVELFMAIVQALPQIIPPLLKAIPEIIGEIVEALWDILPVLLEALLKIVIEIFTRLGEWVSKKTTECINNIHEIWEGIGNWFNEHVIEPIKKFFTQLWEDVKTVFSVVVDWFKEHIVDPFLNSTFFKVLTELATGVWNTIKIVWDVVSSWFDDNIITPLTNFFTELWETVSTAASTAWDAIVEVWEVVSSWFDEHIITPVGDFFSNMWNGVKKKASEAWEGIKEVFGSVASWFENKFSDAWQKVKNVFSTGGKIFDGIKEGITSAFKTVVNAIIGGINKVIAIPFNSINNTLDKIRNVSIAGAHPFSGLISRFNVPQIPLLASGGVLRKATLAMLGENGAEAVVPLEKNTGWLNKIADKLNSLLSDDIISLLSEFMSITGNFVSSLPELGNEAVTELQYITDAVKASRSSTSQEYAATSNNKYSSKSDRTEAIKTGNDKPKYIENNISIDGKQTAKVLTPYVEKELAWRDK